MNNIEIQHWFNSNGIAISDWADEHGFTRHTVYAVVSGRSRALRGEAHHVAVALGLKQPQIRERLSAPENTGAPSENRNKRGGENNMS